VAIDSSSTLSWGLSCCACSKVVCTRVCVANRLLSRLVLVGWYSSAVCMFYCCRLPLLLFNICARATNSLHTRVWVCVALLGVRCRARLCALVQDAPDECAF
jgi:hypothetical protein